MFLALQCKHKMKNVFYSKHSSGHFTKRGTDTTGGYGHYIWGYHASQNCTLQMLTNILYYVDIGTTPPSYTCQFYLDIFIQCGMVPGVRTLQNFMTFLLRIFRLNF